MPLVNGVADIEASKLGSPAYKSSKRPSLRAAIDAQCKQCVYDPLHGGTWREQVRDCQGYSCPLYPVRPLPSLRKVNGEAVTAISTPEIGASVANCGP